MKNPIAIGVAVAVTASLAAAATGGGEDDKKKANPQEPSVLENLFEDLRVSYKPGGGITFDGGDDYSLTIGGQIQAKWYYLALENSPDTNSFRLRRARTYFKGHVWSKDITYKLQLEYTGTPTVLDAYVKYEFFKSDDADIGVRLGIQKFRHGLEFDTSSTKLNTVERSIATRTFSDQRSTGVLLEGSAAPVADGTNQLHYGVGLLNGDEARGSVFANRAGTNTGNNELNYDIFLRWDPMGYMGGESGYFGGDLDQTGEFRGMLAGDVFFGNGTAGTPGVGDIETTSFNIQAAMKTGTGFGAQGEVWIRSDDLDGGPSADSNGWYIMGSWTTAPGDEMQWGFVGRVAMVDMKDANPVLAPAGMESGQGNPLGATGGATNPGSITEFQGGVNAFYHKHKLKTQFVFTFQSVDPDVGADSDNMGLDLMFTLVF